MDLTFDESSHRYFLGGVEIPSVSAIIRPIYDKIYGEISQSTLDVASDRGTRIHRAIEFMYKYGYNSGTPDIQGYLEGYSKFRNDHRDWIQKHAELRTYHKSLLFGMTIDQVYDTPSGIVICDLKTPKIAHPKAWSVQLSGYKIGYESQHEKVSEIVALQLFESGKYVLHKLSDETDVFLSCLQIFRFEVI